MNYKNAYDYLLNFSSKTQPLKSNPIQQNEEIQEYSARKPPIFQSEHNCLKKLMESKTNVKINLGENPFDLACSLNQQQLLQQSKQFKQKEMLQQSNKQEELYEIKIKAIGPIKEEVLSFLQLLGQVEIKRLSNQNQYQQN